MKRITFSISYKTLKELLSNISNIPFSSITAHTKISDFGFTGLGLIKFTNNIVEAYKDYNLSITNESVGNCVTVNDLAILVWDAIPSDLKEGDITLAMPSLASNRHEMNQTTLRNEWYYFLVNEIDNTKRIENEAIELGVKINNKDDNYGVKSIYITINL